jgi:hypothetical protein
MPPESRAGLRHEPHGQLFPSTVLERGSGSWLYISGGAAGTRDARALSRYERASTHSIDTLDA